MRVRVIAVNRAVDTETGNSIWQVAFGRIVPFTEEMRQRVVSSGGTAPTATEVGLNSLVLIHRFDGPVPYLLDSEWELEIGAKGAVTLRETSN
jgi:hypothetical protein